MWEAGGIPQTPSPQATTKNLRASAPLREINKERLEVTTKLRTDAWEAALDEGTQHELYRLTKPRTEAECKEGRPYLRDFERDVLPYLSLRGIVAPGRSSWYRFLGRMREEESAQTVISVETSKRIARGIQAAKVDAGLAADMLTSLAVDEAAKPSEARNEKVMQIFASAAAMFRAAEQRDRELNLKADKGRRDAEALKLAREKFEAAEKRLDAVKDAVKSAKATGGGLSEETLRKIEEAAGLL